MESRTGTKALRWRRGWDSNPRYGCYPYNGLANRRLQPLGHPSTDERVTAYAAVVLEIRVGDVNLRDRNISRIRPDWIRLGRKLLSLRVCGLSSRSIASAAAVSDAAK